MKNIRILETHSWDLCFRNPTGTGWGTQGTNSSWIPKAQNEWYERIQGDELISVN